MQFRNLSTMRIIDGKFKQIETAGFLFLKACILQCGNGSLTLNFIFKILFCLKISGGHVSELSTGLL